MGQHARHARRYEAVRAVQASSDLLRVPGHREQPGKKRTRPLLKELLQRVASLLSLLQKKNISLAMLAFSYGVFLLLSLP